MVTDAKKLHIFPSLVRSDETRCEAVKELLSDIRSLLNDYYAKEGLHFQVVERTGAYLEVMVDGISFYIDVTAKG